MWCKPSQQVKHDITSELSVTEQSPHQSLHTSFLVRCKQRGAPSSSEHPILSAPPPLMVDTGGQLGPRETSGGENAVGGVREGTHLHRTVTNLHDVLRHPLLLLCRPAVPGFRSLGALGHFQKLPQIFLNSLNKSIHSVTSMRRRSLEEEHVKNNFAAVIPIADLIADGGVSASRAKICGEKSS